MTSSWVFTVHKDDVVREAHITSNYAAVAHTGNSRGAKYKGLLMHSLLKLIEFI